VVRRGKTERRSAAAQCCAILLLCLLAAACGGSPGARADPQQDEVDAQPLARDEVGAIMDDAARATNQPIAVAVSDRRGVLLGVGTNFGMDLAQYRSLCVDALQCPATDTPPDSDCAVVNRAVQLARTAAFFGADQTPLTSRSVRFLSGEHFPPSIRNTGAAALFGIENTNRGCSFDTAPVGGSDVPAVPRALSLAAQFRPSLRCENADDPTARCGCTSGIAPLPGGVPIYKNGRMAGGVGVAIRGVTPQPDPVAAADAPNMILRKSDASAAFSVAEFAARSFAGDKTGFPTVVPKGLPGVCANVSGITKPACCATGCFLGILPSNALPFDPVIFVDGVEIPEVDLNPSVSGVGSGEPLVTPLIIDPNDPTTPDAAPAASQWLFGPRASTAGAPPLNETDVQQIIESGINEARAIRAAIRLPLEARSVMVLAVADTKGELLGVFRMSDATVFSIDVAVAKSRNVVYFSDATQVTSLDTMDCPGTSGCRGPAFPPGTALTNRTLSFGAQPFFPSGIDGTIPGPFRRAFINDSAVPCTNGQQTTNGRQNGIVFFPGSAPLYRHGVLVGGLGVSGDGVEQDDLVSFASTQAPPDFEPPAAIRADQLFVRGVRLPYLKFNRQPRQ
jgi:uncharacterized protein GlcG (DUF336 family)